MATGSNVMKKVDRSSLKGYLCYMFVLFALLVSQFLSFFLVILLFLFLFFLDLESSFHKAKLFPFGIDKAV